MTRIHLISLYDQYNYSWINIDYKYVRNFGLVVFNGKDFRETVESFLLELFSLSMPVFLFKPSMCTFNVFLRKILAQWWKRSGVNLIFSIHWLRFISCNLFLHHKNMSFNQSYIYVSTTCTQRKLLKPNDLKYVDI